MKIIFAALAGLLLAASTATADQITLAWDPSPEADVTGYIVEYGPSTAPFTQSVDVGAPTTWTLQNVPTGVPYTFRVIAYNQAGERSDPSQSITAAAGPLLTADKAALSFGIVAGTTQVQTAAQSVRLTQTGRGTATWTVSSSAPWLVVSPARGTGSATVTVSVAPGAATSGGTATLLIAATGTANTVDPIGVSLNVISPGLSSAPFGLVDSPTDNATGVTGSMAMTGWAVDDVDVTRVRIYRDAVAGEAPGPVFVGDATLVEDARPDIAALYPTYPRSGRAGWGYLLLTNMLPNLGNGTFRFSAYAEDVDNHLTLLGTRTVTCANSSATLPFGAIDTPAPGESVAGSAYTNFGWVLARAPRRADVPGGGSTSVVIDGVSVGSPSGWSARADLSALFPVAQYPGINNAVAAFAFDTTTLANGVHTIAWVVTDDQGNSGGIGSRYFRVFNGSGSVAASATLESASRLTLESEIAAAAVDPSGVDARRGYSLDVPLRHYAADADGRTVLQSEELDRIEMRVPGATSGYLVAGSVLRPLPIGSTFDTANGTFIWQPGVAFVGSYDLVFVRHEGNRLVRQDIRVVLNPKGSNRVGPQLVVDIAGPVVAGWAADLDAPSGTGIETIHVWAYPRDGGAPVFVGEASYGGKRPDVAAVYGDQFERSGFGIRVTGLELGAYDLAIFPWSAAKHTWLPATVVPLPGVRSAKRP